MPTSISAFPIQQEYPRNLPVAPFPNGDDVLLLDGATGGTRALPASIITQLAAAAATAQATNAIAGAVASMANSELSTAITLGTFYI